MRLRGLAAFSILPYHPSARMTWRYCDWLARCLEQGSGSSIVRDIVAEANPSTGCPWTDKYPHTPLDAQHTLGVLVLSAPTVNNTLNCKRRSLDKMVASDAGSSQIASPLDTEKGRTTIVEDAGLANMHDPDAGLSDADRAAVDKKLLRKLDFKLIPWLTLLYLASFLDRTNIGNAKVDGLINDLRMTGGQYSASLSIFFVSYAGFEPLTNILLKRLRPSIFIPGIMVAWGLVMTFMGFAHNFSGLAAARFFLGVTEGAENGCE